MRLFEEGVARRGYAIAVGGGFAIAVGGGFALHSHAPAGFAGRIPALPRVGAARSHSTPTATPPPTINYKW